ncbi:hypothetical protein Q5762_39175, partial [Streptomyces sp. P9(2023)]|uniref:hypothetical protein n=1 Tax=Streptomyces sp. P9(2023) TaxID=3064394 RepID=UPI0028F44961
SNIIYEGDLSSFSSDFFAMPAYIYEPSEGIIQLGYLETEIIYEVFKNGTVSLSQNSSSYDYSNYTTELNIDVPFIIEDSRFDD